VVQPCMCCLAAPCVFGGLIWCLPAFVHRLQEAETLESSFARVRACFVLVCACVRACAWGAGEGGAGGVLASDASAPPTGLLLAAAPSADEQPGSACGSCAPLRLSAALADAHPPSECDGVSAGAAAGDLSSAEATGSRSAGDEGWVAVGTRVVGGG
jgi:hypothetical protein